MSPTHPLSIRCVLPIALCLAFVACSTVPDEDPLVALERELASGASDPVVAIAINDPIMVDTVLAGRANANAVRPSVGPYTAPIPPIDVAKGAPTADLIARETLETAPAALDGDCPECVVARDALTLAALAQPMSGPCAAALGYSQRWATNVPGAVPLVPNARLVEAAGVADPRCDLRVVRFQSDLDAEPLLDWYFTRARQAGYTSTRKRDDEGQMLAGRHGDGSRYTLFTTPRAEGGSELALVIDLRRAP